MIEKNAKGVPCHFCGKEATQEIDGFPVCDSCAANKAEELKTEIHL